MGMARQSTGTATPVLLTRPEAQSRAFGAALVERFGQRLRPILSPIMAPVFLTPDLPDGPFAAVIFTSSTGVRAAKGLPLPPRAFCVGAQTAAAALSAGFQTVSADGDAGALVAAVLAYPPAGRLLHLRGQDTRGDVAEQLNSAGTDTLSLVVYRQDPQPLTDEALDLLASADTLIVPLFSPRTATLFRQALPQTFGARLQLVVMSAAVAEAVDGLAHYCLEVARRPDADAMLEAVARLADLQPLP